MRRKWAAPFRDKLWKEISFARGHQFLHLFFWNCALQNRFADAKCAFFGSCGSALADKGILELINLSFLTNRTNADRFVLGRVDLLRCAINSLRFMAPFSIRFSLYSHSPVISGEQSSATPMPRSNVINAMPFAVAIKSRPCRVI